MSLQMQTHISLAHKMLVIDIVNRTISLIYLDTMWKDKRHFKETKKDGLRCIWTSGFTNENEKEIHQTKPQNLVILDTRFRKTYSVFFLA